MNTVTHSTCRFAHSSYFRGLIATAVFGALASSFAAVCTATDGTGFSSQTVKYGDLNISNAQGAAELYRRIVLAANDVCGSRDVDTMHLGARQRMDACVRKATADAVTRVGHPELIAVYNSKNRQPLPITVASAQTR